MVKVRHIRSAIALNLAVAVAIAVSHGVVVPKPSSPTLEPADRSHGLTLTHAKQTHGTRIVLAGTRCTLAGRC